MFNRADRSLAEGQPIEMRGPRVPAVEPEGVRMHIHDFRVDQQDLLVGLLTSQERLGSGACR